MNVYYIVSVISVWINKCTYTLERSFLYSSREIQGEESKNIKKKLYSGNGVPMLPLGTILTLRNGEWKNCYWFHSNNLKKRKTVAYGLNY